MSSERLPVVSGKDLVRVLSKFGYYVRAQRGSHITLKHPYQKPVTVPNHPEVKRGLVLEIIKTAGISREELNDNL